MLHLKVHAYGTTNYKEHNEISYRKIVDASIILPGPLCYFRSTFWQYLGSNSIDTIDNRDNRLRIQYGKGVLHRTTSKQTEPWRQDAISLNTREDRYPHFQDSLIRRGGLPLWAAGKSWHPEARDRDSSRSIIPLTVRDLTSHKGAPSGFESRTGHLCKMQ